MWLESEFSTIEFEDKRLAKRFKQIMQEFMKKAQCNISSTFDSWSSIKGCYRFFSNEKVNSKLILDAHITSTLSRIEQEEKQVFIIHDTTYIDYKNRKKTADLDCITQNLQSKNIAKGLILHNSFAVNDASIPLGLVNQKFIERKEIKDIPKKIKKHLIHNKPVEEKESYRWIEAIKNFQQLECSKQNDMVHIADREGDFYELYRECAALDSQFLIRASHNRAINKIKRREPCKDKAFDYFRSLEPEAKITTDIQVNKETKYRKAELSIAFKKFTLPPSPNRTVKKDGEKLHNIDLYGIIIREKEPPANHEPLEWLLFTNIPVNNIDDAIEKMHWYSLRWNVETFHKILKSGCSVEDAQLRNKDKLTKYITTKSIIAWRIFWLSRIGRLDGHYDCNVILTKIEQTILFKRFNNGQTNTESISVKQALNWIGKLGGYIGRNSDSPPGIITIWQGWTRFMNMVDDYKIICG
jgi:hypothetical protein